MPCLAPASVQLSQHSDLPESPFGEDWWPIFMNGAWVWVHPPLLLLAAKSEGAPMAGEAMAE